MAARKSVADLAKRKRELLDELRALDVEIALRAGELDAPEPAAKAKARTAPGAEPVKRPAR